ncbi:hypothetical protein Acy02nite_07960 [Actinoplanes cyaneus]|uniref:Uncharacterized protein n=1 Tax=Actinoplanes cyaneus TaxID=52696 RepID=A0A919LYE4_9ACTN|nr:hypothetical protein Acy02nite_07960 [Actinoplanes cyaneus]
MNSRQIFPPWTRWPPGDWPSSPRRCCETSLRRPRNGARELAEPLAAALIALLTAASEEKPAPNAVATGKPPRVPQPVAVAVAVAVGASGRETTACRSRWQWQRQVSEMTAAITVARM